VSASSPDTHGLLRLILENRGNFSGVRFAMEAGHTINHPLAAGVMHFVVVYDRDSTARNSS
jgi:hypothetical protein